MNHHLSSLCSYMGNECYLCFLFRLSVRMHGCVMSMSFAGACCQSVYLLLLPVSRFLSVVAAAVCCRCDGAAGVVVPVAAATIPCQVLQSQAQRHVRRVSPCSVHVPSAVLLQHRCCRRCHDTAAILSLLLLLLMVSLSACCYYRHPLGCSCYSHYSFFLFRHR